MNLKALWKPILAYTGLLGLLTVGAVYLTTHSGLFMLMIAGGGLLLVVIGGGTAGLMSPSGAEHSEDPEMVIESTSMLPHIHPDTSLRLTLLLYGFGVFLWSFIVLLTLRDTLV